MDASNPTRLQVVVQKLRIPLLLGRLALGIIFLAAAYGKLHVDGRWHFGDYSFLFAMTINSYQLPGLPVGLMMGAARVFPWVELVLGALLVIGVGLRWTGIAVSLCVLLFIGMLTWAVSLGLQINCGCFGGSYVKPSTELLRDFGLLPLALLITLAAFVTHRGRRATAA